MKGISETKTSRLLILIVCFLIPTFLLICFILGEKISPEASTNTRLRSLMLRIFDYVELNGKPPRNLQELPPRPGYDNSVKDGWGNRISYIRTNTGDITITSFGKDGKDGGDGDAADISFTFDPYDKESYYEIIGMDSPSSCIKLQLDVLHEQIVEYFEINQELPLSLEDLHLNEIVFSDSTKDIWGNEILYEIRRHTVVLRSLGKDGVRGGRGENADIIVSFKVGRPEADVRDSQ